MFNLNVEAFKVFVWTVSVVPAALVLGSEIGRFNYVVDCSACYSLPVQNVDSYSCKVRCDINGKILITWSVTLNLYRMWVPTPVYSSSGSSTGRGGQEYF